MSRSREYLLSGEALLCKNTDSVDYFDHSLVSELENLYDSVYFEDILESIKQCDEYKTMEEEIGYHIYFTGHVVFETSYHYEYGEEHEYFVELDKIIFRRL